MHEVLVNRLGGLSLPRKSVVRLTDRPDMTLDVYRGRKTTMQQCNKMIFYQVFKVLNCLKLAVFISKCGICHIIIVFLEILSVWVQLLKTNDVMSYWFDQITDVHISNKPIC